MGSRPATLLASSGSGDRRFTDLWLPEDGIEAGNVFSFDEGGSHLTGPHFLAITKFSVPDLTK